MPGRPEVKRRKDAAEIQEQLEHGRLENRNKKQIRSYNFCSKYSTEHRTSAIDQAQNPGLSRKEAHDMAQRTSATKQVQLIGSSQAPVVISGAQIMPYAHSSKGQNCTTLGYITDN
ncbi:hypothetical protein M9H77_25909 [Catharanthus roseus]|uniref:Uncharacterized protein n=1 Tax=Catharanthus roseus TaxID=4058 RepID=A0ACC0A8L6_CATRO|nr:hypothetical protein M9H77_25909 [Catharanthus roseus]